MNYDLRFQNDISIIKKRLSRYPLRAVILYGSYGRNEGGIIIRKDGKVMPYNDYDILMITEKNLSAVEIKSIKKYLLEKINIKWIDISQKKISSLKRLKPSIFNFDLKYGSTVIQGEENILNQIPFMDASDIPLEEANILFKTRMWTFLGSLNKSGFKNDLYGEQARFFRNQMAKAVLSIIDVCLLQKRAYHQSYKERVQLFAKYFPQKKELCRLSEWALEEKLQPSSTIIRKNEIKQLYQNIHKYFLIEMFSVLSKRFHFKIDSPEKLILLWKFYPTNFLKRIIFFIINRSKKFENQIMLDSAQLYLLMSYNNKNKNRQYLNKANQILNSLIENFNQDLPWDDARQIVAEMRLR